MEIQHKKMLEMPLWRKWLSSNWLRSLTDANASTNHAYVPMTSSILANPVRFASSARLSFRSNVIFSIRASSLKWWQLLGCLQDQWFFYSLDSGREQKKESKTTIPETICCESFCSAGTQMDVGEITSYFIDPFTIRFVHKLTCMRQ